MKRKLILASAQATLFVVAFCCALALIGAILIMIWR
jgi:hypothetical protein